MSRYLPILISLFVVWVTPLHSSFAKTRVLDRTLVTVNDEVILKSDIEKFINKAKKKSFQELFGGIDGKNLSDEQIVLQLLIEEKIIDQYVKKLDLKVSDEEVEGQIRAILTRNGITREQLMGRLKQLGTTQEEYKDGIRRQLERRNLIEREIRPTLEVSEEKLQQFYRRNAGKGKNQISYRIAHVFIQKGKRSSKDAKARAMEVYEEIKKSPEKFPEYVRDYSDDDSTIPSNGELGIFSLDSLVDEFRSAVPETPVGKVTKPIETSAGFHVVKVLDRKFSDFESLSNEEKSNFRNELVASELERKMALWLERKMRESHIRRFDNASK